MRANDVFAVVIEAEDERSVHLNAVVVQDAHAARVVGGLRRLFVRVGEVVVGERFEADEDAGASGQRHVADQAGIVGDVDGDGGAPDFVERAQRGAERVQVVAARAEIVVDEHRVGLAIFLKLGSDLVRMAHAVGHAQAVGGEIAEAAAVVASAGGDEAGRREKAAARKNRAPRRRIVAVVVFILGDVARLQVSGFHVAKNARPELHAVAQRERIGVRRAFVGARQHVQSAEDHLRAASAVPVGKFVGPACKGQMHRDADHLRQGLEWRTAIEQVLVPVFDAPMRGRRGGKAGQRERRREHVLAEAGIGVLGIERIDQEGVAPLDESARLVRIERGRGRHFAGNPALRDGAKERLVGVDHAMYFI